MRAASFSGLRKSLARGTSAVVGLALVLLVAAGCSDDTTGPSSSISSVEITPTDPPELAINQTQDFDVVALDSDGNEVQVSESPSWSSSNTSVVTIDGDGVATAVDSGQAEITATLSGISADSAVTQTVINLVAQPSASTSSSSLTASSASSGSSEFQVAVNDLDGDAVSGLSAGDFSIPDQAFSGGTISFSAQSVSSPRAFSFRGAGKAPLGQGAFSAALVIDQSGSMGTSDPQDARLAASKQFVQEMESGDETALYTFDDVVTQQLGMTGDPTTLKSTVDGLGGPGGSTALYDAGVEACNFVANNASNGSNMYVVLLTDGQDNASTNTEADLIDACNNLGVKVITVGFGGSLADQLARIANQTGGLVVHETDASVLLSSVRSLPPIMRGDRSPSVVNFSVSASGVDLTQGGTLSGQIEITVNGNTITTPFWVQW